VIYDHLVVLLLSGCAGTSKTSKNTSVKRLYSYTL